MYNNILFFVNINIKSFLLQFYRLEKGRIDAILEILEHYNFYGIEVAYGLRVSFIKCKNFLFPAGDEIFDVRWDYTPV